MSVKKVRCLALCERCGASYSRIEKIPVKVKWRRLLLIFKMTITVVPVPVVVVRVVS